jgi:uncharacterized protein (TIGR04168 family)
MECRRCRSVAPTPGRFSLICGGFWQRSGGSGPPDCRPGDPQSRDFGQPRRLVHRHRLGPQKVPLRSHPGRWVDQQLQALGETHVGYGKLDLPQLGLSIVGGRPFSWGGAEWKYPRFYEERYGISGFESSIARIQQAIDEATSDCLLFVGHCGPTGLGDAPEDPCGRDWKPLGGDFGDPDLAAGIDYARQRGKTIPLVAFGHMHHGLRHRKDCLRRRIHVDTDQTLHLNAASVPRWVQVNGSPGAIFPW